MTERLASGLPDRSLATSARVHDALSALLTEARMAARWHGLTEESRSSHRRILRAFLDHGCPPEISAIPGEILADLRACDLVHVRDGGIALAYPFAAKTTDFAVTVEAVRLHAVCAVDALGVAAMAGREAHVSCLCPVCRVAVELTVAADGLTLKAASHPDPRVWTGVMQIGACAADSQCKSMLLFCCADHLEAWRARQPNTPGFDLSLAEGIQLGAAIFRPFLEDGSGEVQR